MGPNRMAGYNQLQCDKWTRLADARDRPCDKYSNEANDENKMTVHRFKAFGSTTATAGQNALRV